MEQDQQMSPEQYRVEILKRRFAQRVTELEDECATLATQVAQASQEIEHLREQLNAKEADAETED